MNRNELLSRASVKQHLEALRDTHEEHGHAYTVQALDRCIACHAATVELAKRVCDAHGVGTPLFNAARAALALAGETT